MDFVSLFIEYHKNYESPTSFWKWGAYAAIAGTLRSKVYFKYRAGKIYPNIYVIFLADSAEYRKGAPIKAAKKLLTLIRATKIYSGTASIQGVLDELSQDVADKSGVTIKGGSCIISAEELASFFVADPRLIPMLTDMWEYYEEFPYRLKSGTVIIKDLCTTLLAASNETFLREVYDSRAVYGGLLGRTFLIKPDETRPADSLMFDDLITIEQKPLVDALLKIKELNGEIRITHEAKLIYDTWYKDLYAKYKTHPDRTGVMQRMHTNVIKLAIILAASNLTLEINEETFQNAIIEVTSLRNNYEIYVMSSGKADTSVIATKLLTELVLAKNHTIKRKDFLVRYWMEIELEPFDQLLLKLEQGGIIRNTALNMEVAFQLTPTGLAYFNKVKEA